jgi:outer membrane lipoprotein-sorting protein
MKKFMLFTILIPSVILAQTAEQIIKKVDKNQLYVTQHFTILMTIQKGERKLIKEFYGYGMKQGEKAFLEFTNPEDRGVKYLKIDKELWIYFPDADDIMKISGHMLRQGMMGSDISYEDIMETEHIEKKYNAKRLKDRVVEGKDCFVIDLTAKVPDATYARQVAYIDKDTYVPIEVEMYAKGGRLIKKMSQSDIQRVGWRNIPKRATIQDMRKRNSKTLLEFKEIKFDAAVPERAFSKRNLKR